MKILWCHEVSYTDKPVYEYQDFAERLASSGHDVEVIDFNEYKPSVPGSWSLSRTGAGAITLTSIPHHGWPLVKFAEAKFNYERMLLDRLRRGSIDVAFVYSIFINGTRTLSLCKQYGVPVVYRVLDAYHRLREGALARTILKAGERRMYRYADFVLPTNEQMGSYVRDLAGLPSDVGRLRILNHGVDTMHFRPRERDAVLAASLGIDANDVIALFLGTTYTFSGLHEFVKIMPSVLAVEPNFKLLIVGGGEQDQTIRATAEALGLTSRVLQAGWVDYQDLPAFMSLGDITLTPFEVNDITRDIVPIKVLQYLAAGMPLVCTPLADVVRKFPPELSAVRYSMSDTASDFAKTLCSLLTSRSQWRDIGDSGRAYVQKRFSVDAAVNDLEALLQEAVREPRGMQ